MSDGVDPAMNAVKPADGDTVPQLTVRKTQGIKLPDRDYAMLARCQVCGGHQVPRACEALFRHRASKKRRAGRIRPENETSDPKETQK
jgi:hypothetical protein